MAVNLPECPASLKQIQHYLKTASEHDARDPVVSYWCRLHALQVGLKLSTSKTPEETKLLMGLMDWLETQKKTMSDNDAITNEIAAQAHLENYALKLFEYADKQDREGNFGKNVVKAFYTSGMIYDVLATFGELTEEVLKNRKYAKWKAAYIHTCLKNGETPVSGPMQDDDDSLLDQPGPSGTTDNSAVPGVTPGPAGFVQPGQAGFVQPNPGNAPGPANIGGFSPYTPSPANIGGFSPYTPSPSNPPYGRPDAALNPSVGDIPKRPPPSEDSEDYAGGFTAYVAPHGGIVSPSYTPTEPHANVTLTPDQISKAQKYCKWASSSLTYDDVKTAVSNLQKALELLTTGNDPL